MHISRETITNFFGSNRSRGVKIDSEMLWGFFFVDPNQSRLEDLAEVLALSGFRNVGILDRDDDGDYHLHLERVESYSVETLYNTCIELHELSRRHNVKDFDGFDVGNVDGSPLHSA